MTSLNNCETNTYNPRKSIITKETVAKQWKIKCSHLGNWCKSTNNYENESNIEIYSLLEKLFNIIDLDNWLVEFLYLELNILKSIGYDINFKDYVVNKNINGQTKYDVDSSQKIIPNFLIDKKIIPENTKDIYSGYSIVGDFLDKTIIQM